VTPATRRRRRRRAVSLVVAAVAAVAAALLVLPAAPASAHARLIGTDPEEGAVLQTAPESIRFRFNEPVSAVPDGVQVYDAQGDLVSAGATARDDELVVVLDEQAGPGTLVVVWRVVSIDGHPVSGSLSFSIGAPSGAAPAPGPESAATDVPMALSLTRWAGYVGLLMAGGLVWFAVLLVPRDAGADRARARVAAAARVATVAGVAGWLGGLPLTGAYQRGVGLEGVTDAETWATLPAEEYLVVGAITAGLVVAAVLVGRDPASRGARVAGASVAAAVAVLAPAATGHPRAVTPELLAVAADALHLLAGAVWLGGLTGLALVLPALSGRPGSAADVLARFSTAAATLLVALVGSGAFLAWRIVGSWEALVSTGYGRLLLVKIAVAALAVLLASWNRFRLLPRVKEIAGHEDSGAVVRVLTRTTGLEAGVLAAVLLVTGFLVDRSPEEPLAAAARPAGTDVQRTGLGANLLLVTMEPRRPGPNILRIQVQDTEGEPVEGVEAPDVRVSSDRIDLGLVPVTAVAPGSYEAAVVVPRPGVWEVQVSLRTGEFESSVATVTFQVPAD
jgi:copper transport protein